MITFHLNERHIPCKSQTSLLREPRKIKRKKKKAIANFDFSLEAVEFLQHPVEDNLTLCGGRCNLLWWWDRCKNAVPEKMAVTSPQCGTELRRKSSLPSLPAAIDSAAQQPRMKRWTATPSCLLCSLYGIDDQLMLHSKSEIGLKDVRKFQNGTILRGNKMVKGLFRTLVKKRFWSSSLRSSYCVHLCVQPAYRSDTRLGLGFY